MLGLWMARSCGIDAGPDGESARQLSCGAGSLTFCLGVGGVKVAAEFVRVESVSGSGTSETIDREVAAAEAAWGELSGPLSGKASIF
jgi:hypothetical protein